MKLQGLSFICSFTNIFMLPENKNARLINLIRFKHHLQLFLHFIRGTQSLTRARSLQPPLDLVYKARRFVQNLITTNPKHFESSRVNDVRAPVGKSIT